MLKKISLITILIINCFLSSIAQNSKLFFINVGVDTVVNAFETKHRKCKSKDLSSFVNDSLVLDAIYNIYECVDFVFIENHRAAVSHDSLVLKGQKQENEKDKLREVSINYKLDFLFSWQDSFLLSIVYDTISQVKSNQLKFLPINSKLFEQLDKQNYVNQYSAVNNYNDLFNISRLKDEISDSIKLSYQDIRNNEGVYWLLNQYHDEQSENDKTIFLTIDQEGNSQFIRPVQFWVYMPILNTVDYYEKYGLQPVSAEYDHHLSEVVKIFKDRGRFRNKTDLKLAIDNQYHLIALGYGDKEITELPKWEKLIDFNVFGNYKCMPRNYFIPSLKLFAFSYPNPKIALDSNRNFLIPLDSVFRNNYNEKGKHKGVVFEKIETGHKTRIGFPIQQFVDLKRKFDCTGIYGINQYEFAYGKFERLGTVNNIEYMPGVYFLPDYFKIRTINGLSLEEFANKECER